MKGERYALRSWQGELGMWGPPRERSDDGSVRKIADRMSEADFRWKPAIERRGGWDVEGDVQPGTATLDAYQRFGELPGDAKTIRAAERAWLHALDGRPEQFIPAHMMLLSAAGRWREVSSYASTGLPYVYLPSHPAWSKPDLGDREAIRQQWHKLFDAQWVGTRYASVAAVSLILPFFWITQPRREARSKRRWAFNGVATISFLLLLSISIVFVRSYRILDQWGFAPKLVASTAQLPPSFDPRAVWATQARLQSVRACLELDETTYTQVGHGNTIEPVGHIQVQASPYINPLKAGGFRIHLSRQHWSVPGMMYDAKPPVYVRASGILFVGQRRFVASWWIPWLLAAIPCMGWALSQWKYRKVDRWRRRNNLCLACGYDLRATPDQCPECGARPGKA